MAGAFEIEIKGAKELAYALQQYPKISEPIFQRAIGGLGATLAKHTLKENPVPFRTGRLLQSFVFKVGRLQGRWYPTAKYAAMVEFGRGMVFPQNRKVLSWVNKSGGSYVASASGKMRYHAGTSARVFARFSRPSKPRPYMRKIVQASQRDVDKIFVKALDDVARALAENKRT